MHPYFQAIIESYAQSGRPYFHQGTPDEARAMMSASLLQAREPFGLPDLASVADDVISGSTGRIPIRRYVPLEKPLGKVVYLHSGGWVLGTLNHADAVCRRLTAYSQCELISVDYRLAPEHPFPAPLDDAWTVICEIAKEGDCPLLLAGESAGGNLAAACSIRARDQGGPPIAGTVLAYPVTNCDFETESYREIGSKNWLVSTQDMRWYWDHYCPKGVDRSDPLVSPLRLPDATGLPPAYICVAELDPLRSEGQAYALMLKSANVPVAFSCDQGMLHGYWSAAGVVDEATQAVAMAGAWMHSRITATDALS